VGTESAYTGPARLSTVTEHNAGKRILLVVAAAVVATSGIVGFFVGSNGSVVGPEAALFGLVTVPTTPATMAAAGVVLSAAMLAVLFGLVELATRLESTGTE
jgi:hypothetical protein